MPSDADHLEDDFFMFFIRVVEGCGGAVSGIEIPASGKGEGQGAGLLNRSVDCLAIAQSQS
eukprot:9005465-Karenia_brevis.AAC.1